MTPSYSLLALIRAALFHIRGYRSCVGAEVRYIHSVIFGI